MKEFYDELVALKKLVRRGWLLRLDNKERLESDAEHIFSCQMLAAKIIRDKKLQIDQDKVLKMLLYHEIGEIEVGDITVADNIPLAQKYHDEQIAVKNFAVKYDMPEIYDLWEEFEENKTPEARFCKMIDKLDSVMQAKEFANEYNKPELFDEFYHTAEKRIEGYEDAITKYIANKKD